MERLAAAGEPVRALVRRKGDFPPGVETVLGDLATNSGVSDAARGVSTVIHIAGATRALRPDDYYAGNVRAAENIARAVAGRGVRFVHVSSLAACGPCRECPAVDETTAPAPVSHYGKSKLEGELRVRALIPDAVIVRPPVVYGPRDVGVYSILKSVSQGVVPQIAGGERWFSMVYVNDLVDGLLAAARTPGILGRTYFVSHPEPLTWAALGAEAARIMRRKYVTIRVPVPAAYTIGWLSEAWAGISGKAGVLSREKITEARQGRWVCNPARAAAELSLNSYTSHERGLTQTLAWYKEAGWLKY